MAAQFESLTYPFIIMFSLPFAFSGVLMALFFTGSTLSVMSLLGGIMLIGIVVKNGMCSSTTLPFVGNAGWQL